MRAQALDDAASLAFWQNDKAATTALSEAALAMRRELDDKHGIAISLIHLGTDKRLFEKDYAAARALYEESLAILRELGNELSIAYALCNLGNLALDQGDYTTAHLLMRRNLVTFRDHQEIWAINFMLDAFAGLAAHQGQPERALRLAEAGEALREAVGIVHPSVTQAWVDELLNPAFQALDEDQAAAAKATGRAMTLEQAVAYALEDS